MWDAIWETGQGHGLKPLGLEALDIVRIESGLIFADYEFDDQVDPFEAGIGFAVKLDSDDDFVGKDALPSARPIPSGARRARARRQRDGGPWRRGVGRPPPRGRHHEWDAPARRSARTSRCAAWRCEYGELGTESRSASSTAFRSASPPRSCACRSTTRRRRGRGRDARCRQRPRSSISRSAGRARTASAPPRSRSAPQDEAPDVSDGRATTPPWRFGRRWPVRHGRHRDHHGGRRAGARHDRERVHVGVARAATRTGFGRPPHEDVQAAPRGAPLRRQRPLRDTERAVGSLRGPSGRRPAGAALRRSCAVRRLSRARSPTSSPRCSAPYSGGDHSLFLGRVEYARHHAGPPLLFHGGRYERLKDSIGAHPAEPGASAYGRTGSSASQALRPPVSSQITGKNDSSSERSARRR